MSGELVSLFDQVTPQPTDAATVQPQGITLPPPAGWPPAPTKDAFHGLPGQVVEKIAPHTEGDRATRGRTLRVSYADWRID
jgi:hypothetical protein